MVLTCAAVYLIALDREPGCFHKFSILSCAKVAPVHLDTVEILLPTLVVVRAHGDQHVPPGRKKEASVLSKSAWRSRGVWKIV
jgi:hypothetical protein